MASTTPVTNPSSQAGLAIPSGAELSWESGSYRYDVRPATRKTWATCPTCCPRSRSCPAKGPKYYYLISVSERDASKPALNEIKKPEKRPEDDTTSFAIGFAGRGPKHCSRLHATANTSSTLWENFQEHVKDKHEEVTELREIGYEDSSNSDQETEEEEEDCDGATRPAVYKCAAAYFSDARKDVVLSHAEWHKPISEIIDKDEPCGPTDLFCHIRPATARRGDFDLESDASSNNANSNDDSANDNSAHDASTNNASPNEASSNEASAHDVNAHDVSTDNASLNYASSTSVASRPKAVWAAILNLIGYNYLTSS